MYWVDIKKSHGLWGWWYLMLPPVCATIIPSDSPQFSPLPASAHASRIDSHLLRGIQCARVCVCVGSAYVHSFICSFVCTFVSIYACLCQVLHGKDITTFWGKRAVCWLMRLRPVALTQHLQHCVTGASEDTGQLALGIYQGGRHVRKLSLVKHNYPDHVVKAAEVGSWQTGYSCSYGMNVLSLVTVL
jgi:hypothetical protein